MLGIISCSHHYKSSVPNFKNICSKAKHNYSDLAEKCKLLELKLMSRLFEKLLNLDRLAGSAALDGGKNQGHRLQVIGDISLHGFPTVEPAHKLFDEPGIGSLWLFE